MKKKKKESNRTVCSGQPAVLNIAMHFVVYRGLLNVSAHCPVVFFSRCLYLALLHHVTTLTCPAVPAFAEALKFLP